MKPRFFSENEIVGDVLELVGSEHEHMTRVMRLAAGDSVVLFDGSGDEFDATLEEVRRRSTRLTIVERRHVDRELPFDLTLAVALPKGDRQQWLIEKCVELGVTRVIPMITARGIAQPGENAQRRLERWIVAGSKQCGRNRLMQLGGAERAADFFQRGKQDTVLVADPSGSSNWSGGIQATGQAAPYFAAIGPEGGFTGEEVRLARESGCVVLSLGPRILRVETAAVAMIASLVFANAAGYDGAR